jgi:hypothetical protein
MNKEGHELLADLKLYLEDLLEKIELHKKAYSMMCAEKTKRYNQLLEEKNKLENKIFYDELDAKRSKM